MINSTYISSWFSNWDYRNKLGSQNTLLKNNSNSLKAADVDRILFQVSPRPTYKAYMHRSMVLYDQPTAYWNPSCLRWNSKTNTAIDLIWFFYILHLLFMGSYYSTRETHSKSHLHPEQANWSPIKGTPKTIINSSLITSYQSSLI